MVLVPVLEDLASKGEVHQSAVMHAREGAEFVTHERSSGAGRVSVGTAKSKVKTAANVGNFMNNLQKQKDDSAKKRHTVASLERLNQLLDKLDHGDMLSRVPRTPARELEHILGALNPIEHGLLEPFKRFENGVDAVYKQLMERDDVAEDKLHAIRQAIKRALERGHFNGDLAPLEREREPGAAPQGRRGSVQQANAAKAPAATAQAPAGAPSTVPASAEPLTEAEMESKRQTDRETAESDMSELVYSSYERQGQREIILGGLHTWLDSAADDLEEAMGELQEAGDTREMTGVMNTAGQVEENLAAGRPAYAHKEDFDAQLLIERGRVQLDGLLSQLEANASHARELHDKVAGGLRHRMLDLESQVQMLEVCLRHPRVPSSGSALCARRLRVMRVHAARLHACAGECDAK